MKLFSRIFPGRPPKRAMQMGRNDLCWCGSGKKYKKCHYESDKQHFAKVYAATCSTST